MLRLAQSRAEARGLAPCGVERAGRCAGQSRSARTLGRARLRQQHAAQEPALRPLADEDLPGGGDLLLRQGEQQMLRAGHAAAKLPRGGFRADEHAAEGRRIARFSQ